MLQSDFIDRETRRRTISVDYMLSLYACEQLALAEQPVYVRMLDSRKKNV